MNTILKTFILIQVVTIIFCGNFIAQSPTWQWARGGSGNLAEGISMTSDAVGNSYLTGYFHDTLIFDSYTLIGHNSVGTVFLAKYDSNGNLVWAKCPYGNSNSIGYSVTTDLYGNVYITGQFANTNSLMFDSEILTCSGSVNIFVVKYDSNGNVIWAKGYGGMSADESFAIATDVSGNVFITGLFTTFQISFGSTTLYNSGNTDVFIAKIDSSGQAIWAKSANGDMNDQASSIAIDNTGNAYITGYFYSPVLIFGIYTITNFDVSGNTLDYFIVKYDVNGNEIFAKSGGDIGDDPANFITTNTTGKVFITGYFTSPSLIIGSDTLLSSASYNSFIVEYDTTGQVDWAKTSSIGNSMGSCVAVDQCGNINISGRFAQGSSTIAFDTVTITSPNNGDNMYIVQLNSLGNAIYGTALTCGGDDWNAIAFDNNDNMYVGGDYINSPTIIGNDTLISPADEMTFVAKLQFSCITTATPEPQHHQTISFFPNPLSSTSTLQIQSTLSGIVKVNFYNILGQNVINIESEAPSIIIDRNNFNTGMFFYQVSIGEKIIGSGKFVAE
jgi:hypothetical protein